MSVRPSPLPKDSPNPKRDAILRAALEVFADKGVHAVPVPEIASRAGVGTGTIYRYFESKEALVKAVFAREKAALGRRLTQKLDAKAEPKAIFDEFWRRLVDFARQEPEAFRFLELQDHLPYLGTDERKLERQVLAPMLAEHRRWQKRGVFLRQPRAEVMMALVWGAFVNLFKAERGGYLTLDARDISAARDACWRMCTGAD